MGRITTSTSDDKDVDRSRVYKYIKEVKERGRSLTSDFNAKIARQTSGDTSGIEHFGLDECNHRGGVL